MEQTRGFREVLTCSLDKFSVQFKCNDGNGKVSQVQFQSTGNDVDVSIGTGTDVGLVAICCGEKKNSTRANQMHRGQCSCTCCSINLSKTTNLGQRPASRPLCAPRSQTLGRDLRISSLREKD